MQARMHNPAVIIPEALPAILNLFKATKKGGVPQATLELVHLRAGWLVGGSGASSQLQPMRRPRLPFSPRSTWRAHVTVLLFKNARAR
jgi:hypothetical protein